MESGDLRQLQEKYNSLLITRNKEVRIINGKEEHHAYALRINENGELMVRESDGTIKEISSGRSFRTGNCGYV